LTIGDKAPKLDIEHWVSDRDGDMPHVTEFEKDKVYVVEFWATWCGPCIASMPHLAELQDELADKGVQIISVSKEDLPTVEKFLERKVRGEKDKTYGELTGVYSLTTDPDSSVSKDYMRAAGQNGIPTAFIVGKTGQIEWIGHPTYPKGAMDKVLDQIVGDEWDREEFALAFKEEQEREKAEAMKRRAMDKEMEEVSKLAKELWDMKEGGDAKGALKELDAFAKNLEKDHKGHEFLERIRNVLVMEIGGSEAVEVFNNMVAETENPQAINQLTWGIVERVQAGDEIEDEMLKAACKAAKRAVELAEKGGDDEGTAAIMDTHANLLFLCDKLDEAIEVQKAAMELSDDEQLADFYEKLMEAKKKKDA
jgi:thiol-disulfide isomerase/thioredoxin